MLPIFSLFSQESGCDVIFKADEFSNVVWGRQRWGFHVLSQYFERGSANQHETRLPFERWALFSEFYFTTLCTGN